MALIRPNVGDWYEDLDENTTFSVLSVDDDADVIEIQHKDGTVEEIDTESWNRMSLEEIEAPEAWDEDLDPYDEYDEEDSESLEDGWSDLEDYEYE
jgi:hypothetical protein